MFYSFLKDLVMIIGDFAPVSAFVGLKVVGDKSVGYQIFRKILVTKIVRGAPKKDSLTVVGRVSEVRMKSTVALFGTTDLRGGNPHIYLFLGIVTSCHTHMHPCLLEHSYTVENFGPRIRNVRILWRLASAMQI